MRSAKIIITITALVFIVGGAQYYSRNRIEEDSISSFSSSASPMIPLGISVAEAVDFPQGAAFIESNINIVGPRGERINEKINLKLKHQDNGEYGLVLNPKNSQAFEPGKYRVTTLVETRQGTRRIEQDFLWGVLAINPNKSIYRPGEKAQLAMAVLDEQGMMVCNASLKLQVKSQKSKVEDELSTENGKIRVNEACQKKMFTTDPDFEAEYRVGDAGIYQMTLTAETENGTYTIEDYFEVKESVSFDIERITATRIYPVRQYPVIIRVTPEQDFVGEVIEYAPAQMPVMRVLSDEETIAIAGQVQGNNDFALIKQDDGTQKLVWQADWKAGETYGLAYAYKSVEISPQFYLLGELEFYQGDGVDQGNGVSFTESRQWQIAVDDTTTYSTATTGTTFEVPLGVSTIYVNAWGAGGGGGGGGINPGVQGGDGGGGGFASSTLAVTPGENLTIRVGGGGGGATGGVFDEAGSGGGGGGYSGVFRGGTTLLVAAGGGGGGGGDDNESVSVGDGGAGGETTGTAGQNGTGTVGGGGGTQVSGGTAGSSGCGTSVAGSSLAGGAGADCGGGSGGGGAGGTNGGAAGGQENTSDAQGGGGGGAGGYFGGGGGTGGPSGEGASGGGGGSSYSDFTQGGSGRNAGNNTDADYAGSAGLGGVGGSAGGGTGTDGTAGRVVLIYNIVDNSPTITTVVDTPDPTNPYRSVTFITNWAHDDAGESVKVKVCKTDSLSAQNCGGGFWATSTAFTTDDPTSVFYDIIQDDWGQTRNYYVFVCDDDEDCSASTSGTFSVNAQSTVPNTKIRAPEGESTGSVKWR